mgnify:CR=1 FL=1
MIAQDWFEVPMARVPQTSKEILEIVIVLGWKVPVKPVFPTENNHYF